MVSARSQNAIEEATCPVLVAARGVPLYFDIADHRLSCTAFDAGRAAAAIVPRAVRTLVISDLHLGNRGGNDVLRRPAALAALLEALADIDRLVLLGDLAELMTRHPRRRWPPPSRCCGRSARGWGPTARWCSSPATTTRR